MESKDLEKYLGKIVFIKLKSGSHYLAKVINVDENSINIIDRYQLNHTIINEVIERISEEREYDVE